jgi:hypothetical protein
MKINRTLLMQGAIAGIEVAAYLFKWNKHTDVVTAGKDVARTLVVSFDAFKDKSLTPEEELDIADRLAANKRSLDKALTTVIKDLKEHALQRMDDEEDKNG